jgi:hypothetical protein
VKRFNQTFRHMSIVWFAALMYAGLAAMSVGCAFAHADRIQNHHHHTQDDSSPLHAFCVWACQATSDAVMATDSPKVMVRIVVAPSFFVSNSLLSFSCVTVSDSRAPPGLSLLA